MRFRLFFATLAAFAAGVLLMSAPAMAATQDGPTTLTTLPNGLTVLVQRDQRFPLASIRLYVHAGSAYETDDQAGISHLLEHMVFKGTATRAPGQVAGDIEGVGGYINAATSFDYTVYIVDAPDKHWKTGVDVIRDMIFGSVFDPKELEQEKGVVISELERGEDSPGSKLFKTMQAMVWQGTPYERPIIGTRDTVRGFSRDDITHYISEFYQPRSMLLVVCGNVEPDAVVAEAQRQFGGMANTRRVTPARPLPLPASTGAPRVRVEAGPWNKVYCNVAFPLPGFTSAESVPLDILAQLLGGDKTSRLYRSFKYERQLVDSISASALTLERTGMFSISATLEPDKLDTFWQELVRELASLGAAGFTDEEIARAKLNLEDELFQAKETIPGLASKIGSFQFFEGSQEEEQNYLYALRHVDREQLDAAIKTYFRPDRLTAAALVPGSGPQNQPAAADQTRDDTLAGTLQLAAQRLWPAPHGTAQAATPSAMGKAETIALGNGRTLVLLPDSTLPYTSLDIMYQGGDVLLAPTEQGLGALTARALTKGTATLSATAVEDFLSDRAADLSARAGREVFSLHAKFPTRFSADMLDLVRETLTDPAFAPEEVDREKNNQIASIKAREDQPLALAFRHLFPFLYDGAPYGLFHRGVPEEIARFTPEQVRSFWERQRTKGWIMAVCGDFDREAITALARDLAAQPFAAGPPSYQPPAWGTAKEKTMTLQGRNQAHLLQIFKAPPLGHPDTAGLELLKEILAGQGGLLFGELRDKQGLGYTVTALLWQTPATGFLAFYIGTDPDKVDQALAGFNAIAAQLKTTPLPASDLARGSNLLVGDYYREHQSLASRSQEAATLLTQGFDLDALRTRHAQAATLTPEDIRAIAQRYLKTDEAYLFKVQP
ncbi:MAG: M16 family metallopeptidase [Desulfovibrionaceae bacterium]